MFKLDKALLIAAISLLPATTAQAAPNLLFNGSFESGLSGWATAGTQLTFPPQAVVTNGVTPCCFGEAVPASTVAGGSPDAAGTFGVYFVDDLANQTLSQSIFLAAGAYEIGFDAYAPFNGFNNAGDAIFRGTIAGVQLANYSVHGQNSPGVWLNYSAIANIVTAGFYNVTFEYLTFGGASADVVIDRAYIMETDAGGGVTIGVPLPGTLALFGLALVGLGASQRFRAK